MAALSEKQFYILGHSLGINVYRAKGTKLKEEKTLPQEFYRNRYNTSDDDQDLLELEQLGYVSRYEHSFAKSIPGVLFYVTDAGIEVFRSEFNRLVSI